MMKGGGGGGGGGGGVVLTFGGGLTPQGIYIYIGLVAIYIEK